MKPSKRIVAYVLCAAILNLSSPLVANARDHRHAAGRRVAIRAADLATVNAALARDQVRSQFQALGVDPRRSTPASPR